MTDQTLYVEGRQLEPSAGMVWLVEIEIPSDPVTRVRLTSNNETVAFGQTSEGDPVNYYPYPMRIGAITRSKTGDLPQIQIAIANARREVSTYLNTYNGLVGQPCDVRLITLADLYNYDDQLSFSGEVISSETGHQSTTFNVGTYNIKNITFPRLRFVAYHCRFVFGTPECGYDKTHPLASYTTCGRTYGECSLRGDDEEDVMGVGRQHPKRFGGWRSLPIG